MLWIHPAWQIIFILAMLYVLNLGIRRLGSRHLKRKTRFNWKRHVKWGTASLAGLFVGGVLGVAATAVYWPRPFITGHAWAGVAAGALIAIGLATGMILDRSKPKGHALPLIHGVNNILLVLLSLMQAASGWSIIRNFVLGM